jgi:hypothetical protein
VRDELWTRDHPNMKQESSRPRTRPSPQTADVTTPKLRVCLGFMGPSIWSVCPIQGGRRNGRVINEGGDRVTLPRTIISGTPCCCLGDVQAYSTGFCHRTIWSEHTASSESTQEVTTLNTAVKTSNLYNSKLFIIACIIYSLNTSDYTTRNCKMLNELVKVWKSLWPIWGSAPVFVCSYWVKSQ